MITRRRVVIGAGLLAVAGVTAPLAFTRARPAPIPRDEAHRELTLRLADGFRRQTWSYVSKTWDEHRDTITLHEDETIRLTLVNDTKNAVELPATGPFTGAQLRPGETKSLMMRIDSLDAFDLQAISNGSGLTKACSRQLRRFEVSASHGGSPAV